MKNSQPNKESIERARDLLLDCFEMNNVDMSSGFSATMCVSLTILKKLGFTFEQARGYFKESLDQAETIWDQDI